MIARLQNLSETMRKSVLQQVPYQLAAYHVHKPHTSTFHFGKSETKQVREAIQCTAAIEKPEHFAVVDVRWMIELN